MGLTRGSETSQYPEEKKSNEIPVVAASEVGKVQTRVHALWGCRTPMWDDIYNRIGLESLTVEGESPVDEI